MTIAVLDDGVNPSYYPQIGKLAFDLKVNSQGHIMKRMVKNPTERTHGTICTAIIRKYAPNAIFGSIQILHSEDGRGRLNLLLSALLWCREQKIPIVHMSIGSKLIRDIEPIHATIQEVKKNAIMVASMANTNRFSVPACLDEVIGVRTSPILTGDQYYPIEGGLFEVDFAASSQHELIDFTGKSLTTPLCNSYAAPLVTAKVHNILCAESGVSASACIQRLGGNITSLRHCIQQTPLRLYNFPQIPVVEIIGMHNEIVPVMLMLQKKLIKREYNCLAITRDLSELGLDVLLLPKMFGYLERVLEPDLILYPSLHALNIWDAQIYVSSCLKKVRYQGDTVYMPAMVSDLVLNRIIQRLFLNNHKNGSR